jgi:hypothetical protein
MATKERKEQGERGEAYEEIRKPGKVFLNSCFHY